MLYNTGMKISTIRVTSLDAYENCAFCWYLQATGVKQTTNENMRLGSTIHKSIELFHRGVMRPSLESAPFIQAYEELYKPTKNDLPEYKFSLPFNGITLTGTIDLIKDQWIFEHKTSSARYTQKQVDEHHQATAYSWAYSQIFHEEPRGIRFNIFVKNIRISLQTLDTFRTQEDYKKWQFWAQNILKSIDENKFDPNPFGRFHNFSLCTAKR